MGGCYRDLGSAGVVMGWSVGYDARWNRDIGYGVPATCDHPGCNAKIDRGLSYVCGGEPYGGDEGCGLYFCHEHLFIDDGPQRCERCCDGEDPFPATADVRKWRTHKLLHPSWRQWRAENPDETAALRESIK